MRKLKLQIHLTLGNYVNMEAAGANFKWDAEVIKYCVENLESVDTLLIGRNTAQDLIPFWDDVATDPDNVDFALGERISALQKIVLSNTLTGHPWKNTSIISGDISKEVMKLKKSTGKDILVYGGASFAASLIETGLIDEYYFLVNPIRLGQGVSIFKTKDEVQVFSLVESKPFPCGIIMLHYKPVHK